MTDVGYKITNSKNPEDHTEHKGEGHLTAFYPSSEDNFKIGKLSGHSFAFVNKSFGEFETTDEDKTKQVKVFLEKNTNLYG